MPDFLSRLFTFLRRYPGIFYSLALLVLIPLVLYYNTFGTVKAFKTTMDETVRNQALRIEQTLEVFFAENMDNPQIIQDHIRRITERNDTIRNLRVLTDSGQGTFRIVASQDPQEVGQQVEASTLAIAFSENQSVVNQVRGGTLWNAIEPVTADDGTKLGLISMSLSAAEANDQVMNAVTRAYAVVIAAIILTLLLVVQHTRLFGYVSMAKRLRELDEMKDNFIRMATHELQSPITNIRGYLEALDDEIGDKLNESQTELFERVRVSAKNLSTLVDDILEVSRIEQGRLDLEPESVNPTEVIHEVEQEMAIKAEEKGLELKITVPEEKKAVISVNPKRLRQILTNLVSNAIKYTLDGTVEIAMDVDIAHDKCRIAVRDTGLGISAQEQKNLFQRFYRVKTRKTAGIPGTGLGLWISKQLTEQMGGEIFLESMEGVGSKFTVIFPLAAHKST